MNNDFFAGFENDYLFYDLENDLLIVFSDNGLSEVNINNEIHIGKWRYLKEKNILEIFISEINLKILYKMKIIKDDKEDNKVILKAAFNIKGNDTNNKGTTDIIRKINNIEEKKEGKEKFSLETFALLLVFVLMYLILLFIVSFFPFFQNTGLIYATAIILTIQVLFIKKIKNIVSKFMEKYKEKIENIFF